MAFLDDKAEVIVAVDIEGIGEGGVGQLSIRRQIFACDCVVQFDGTRPTWDAPEKPSCVCRGGAGRPSLPYILPVLYTDF